LRPITASDTWVGAQTHHNSKLVHAGDWKCLGEEVRWHIGPRTEDWTDLAHLNNIPEPIKAKVQVFHSTMVLRVLGYLESAATVCEEGSRTLRSEANLF